MPNPLTRPWTRRTWLAGLAALALAPALPRTATADRQAEPVTVFAAASLKDAMDEIAELYRTAGGSVQISFAGSSTLARQIQHGAPAHVFVSANAGWMDALQRDGLIEPASRVDLLTNRLVLIAAAAADGPTDPEPVERLDLAGILGEGRLAMALIDAVPAGLYGRAALQSLGLWDAVRDRIAQADNVRAALMLVAMQEAPLGIVYATDALADPRVRIVASFAAGSHPPIRYPAAIVAGTPARSAQAFLDFLRGPEAGAVFLRHGFGLAGAQP
ncbi:molybdate ABC transporter substrate-binding protein [Sedimentitalea sp. HM32M-2]|uniref:molybdate ABC transporter substrate-binding protein n=1 Tax=Sedimentitalea sp. HM32M-2 TaxID=3351566 RepID=UPI0036291BA6